MNKTSDTIEGVIEAIRFIQNNWINENSPVWSGDIHEFMANVIHEDVSIFDVMHLLMALSKGEPIDGVESVVVIPHRGKAQSVEIRRKVLTPQEKNP